MALDNDKNSGMYEQIAIFLGCGGVSLICCIVIGIIYVSLYYNFLTPRPELDILYPSSLDDYIDVIKRFATQQKQNVDDHSTEMNEPPVIEVDFEGRREGRPSGYSAEQKKILDDVYRDKPQDKRAPQTSTIKVSAKRLFMFGNVQKIVEGLCKANPNYKSTTISSLLTCTPENNVKTKGCPGDDSSIDADSSDATENPQENNFSMMNEAKTKISSITWKTFGSITNLWYCGIGFILSLALFIVNVIFIFIFTVVLIPLTAGRNLLFGCWGSGLWAKGSFAACFNMLRLYTDAVVGKLFNMFITETWFARMPAIGSTIGLFCLFFCSVLLCSFYMFPLVSWFWMWKEKRFDIGGFGSWAFLGIFFNALIPLRLAGLVIYYSYKLYFSGCLQPRNNELRSAIIKSNRVIIPLRMIFIMLTLGWGMQIFGETSEIFIGLAILGIPALLRDLVFFFKNIVF